MDWTALLISSVIGVIGGFGFGWFFYERFRDRTLRTRLREIQEIDQRLAQIQKLLREKEDGKETRRETEEPPDQ
jgi:hypothetical protein